ncbi:protein ANTI-SILENCING 1 isoform X1 [Typha latifolia]|uniref:protein ANTI-SILENCING 1 isoform X1 n=1 Tax=Typha latifolia TaxID=4733 RepID=UPI003C307BC7
MANSQDQTSNNLQFCWGKRRGVGGAKRDIQFYESFTFDNVKYSLYDCVYLFKHGDPEPYIGKIVKIWEQPDHKKKIKILWFFQANEIQNHLGDHVPLDKEIFLASGEGAGLADINPLEALAGKCCVICTSKDERNPQPSDEEVAMADYIFYRVFDVGNYKISEKLPDRVAGVEVKFILSREVLKFEENAIDGNVKVGSSAPTLSTLSKSESLVGEKLGHMLNSVTRINNTKGKYPREGECRRDEKTSLKSRIGSVEEEGSLSKVVTNSVGENVKSFESESPLNLSSEKPSKKMRLHRDSMTFYDDMHNKTGVTSSAFGFDNDASGRDSPRLQRVSSAKMKLAENKCPDEFVKSAPANSVEKEKKTYHKAVEVTRRPDADRSKWFKGLPWEERLQKADDQGTLVFIQNLDPSYTSSDMEDIIYHALKLTCTAKVVNHPTFGDPNYGQAYAIFRTREAADQAVSTINSGCLVLPDGRPLFCSKGLLKVPKPLPSLTGHLSIDKLKLQMQREKKAVSTSHCSQPNTIEYDMAVEWILAQQKSARWLTKLHKRHYDEWKQVKKTLNMK